MDNIIKLSNSERAEILVRALPYIQNYYGKIVVVKYGGSAMQSKELRDAVMEDVVLLSLTGVKIVLVHGGGPEISDLLTKLGKKTEFVNGLRVTDAETVEAAQMVLAGKINKNLVKAITNNGGKAVGLSGIDGGMLRAEMLNSDLGYVGNITEINTSLLESVLEKGYIPVISTIGFDSEGNSYNINADTAAAGIAAALDAECLVSMTDIPGIMRDCKDPDSLIKRMTVGEARRLIDNGTISGGMIPKAECCIGAIVSGVKKVFIIDGRVPHSILMELLTDEGMGTMFVRE